MGLSDLNYLRARLLPTVLTSIPALSVYGYYIRPTIRIQLAEIPYLPVVEDATFSLAIIFLLIQINRFITKEIFQRWYFKDELEMPTTNYLLWKNDFYIPESKKMIREKIFQDFAIELYNEDQEKANETSARKQICLGVSQIRGSLKETRME